MKKKTIALVMAMVMLFGIAVGGTIAYLTSTKSVENTFTVGKVAIKLDEAVVDENGDATQERTEEGNEYDKIVPGHTYAKDPTVTVLADSEESYVRMLVTIDKKAALDAIFAPDGANLTSIFNRGTESEANWLYNGCTVNGDTRVYEFRYNGTVAATDDNAKLPALFDSITIPETIDNTQLLSIDGLKIDVVAQAIQADGFDSADAAWAAFPTNP